MVVLVHAKKAYEAATDLDRRAEPRRDETL
jgi:hypothetical protein